ncbi:MAG: MMPL family transporter, partial [Planctomycetales bacterium]|nr:MMPL family transporter [Planctomycetales bacterium]
MDLWAHRIASWIANRRLYVWGICFLISAFAGIGYYDANLVKQFFVKSAVESPGAESSKPNRVRPTASSPSVDRFTLLGAEVVLVAKSDHFFSARGAEAMRQVVDALESLDEVARVVWLDRVPMMNIFGLPEPILPRSTASESLFAAAKDKAMRHPLIPGQLLSDDGQAMLLMVFLEPAYILNDSSATTLLRDTADQVAREFPDIDLSFQVTGRVPALITAVGTHEANQLRYQLIGYGMILVMTTILFRGLRAVAIVTLAPFVGVFWTLGFVRYFQDTQNPLVDVILPILVSLVGLTDGVHLMVQIRKLASEGLSSARAAERGLQQVGMACFLTSLTTAIGFGSLMTAESVWVREFGQCCTVGVALCFVAVILVIPLACNSWLGQALHVGHAESLIERNLTRIGGVIRWVIRNRVSLSVFSVLSTIVLSIFTYQLAPDDRALDQLPQSSEAAQAMRFIDANFGGLEVCTVEIIWDES